MIRETLETIPELLLFIHKIGEEKTVMLTQAKLGNRMSQSPDMDLGHCVYAMMNGHRKPQNPQTHGSLFFGAVLKTSMIGVEGGFGFLLVCEPGDDEVAAHKEWENLSEKILQKMKEDPELTSIFEYEFDKKKWESRSKSN